MHLILVLQWIFNGKNVGVTGNVNLYQTDNPKEPSKSPDIVVVEGFETYWNNLEETPSYYVGEDGPPPMVVVEVASKETWRQDLEDKPAKYAAMGVNEYFVFDPNTRTLWTGDWRRYKRLIGWRRNPVSGQYELLEKDADGRLWSEELQSWLLIVKNELQLYTADGQLRLTEAEAKTQLVEMEARRADAATLKAQRLAEKLRKLGVDPEE